MILKNLFISSLKRKNVASLEASEDCTRYSLIVTKHYRSLRERNGETVKEGKFVYSLALMDLTIMMYVGYAVSLKSKMDVYRKAHEIIGKTYINFNGVSLDKYYSGQSILDDFNENTMIFLTPKKNSLIRGRRNWSLTIRRFIGDQMNYLK